MGGSKYPGSRAGRAVGDRKARQKGVGRQIDPAQRGTADNRRDLRAVDALQANRTGNTDAAAGSAAHVVHAVGHPDHAAGHADGHGVLDRMRRRVPRRIGRLRVRAVRPDVIFPRHVPAHGEPIGIFIAVVVGDGHHGRRHPRSIRREANPQIPAGAGRHAGRPGRGRKAAGAGARERHAADGQFRHARIGDGEHALDRFRVQWHVPEIGAVGVRRRRRSVGDKLPVHAPHRDLRFVGQAGATDGKLVGISGGRIAGNLHRGPTQSGRRRIELDDDIAPIARGDRGRIRRHFEIARMVPAQCDRRKIQGRIAGIGDDERARGRAAGQILRAEIRAQGGGNVRAAVGDGRMPGDVATNQDQRNVLLAGPGDRKGIYRIVRIVAGHDDRRRPQPDGRRIEPKGQVGLGAPPNHARRSFDNLEFIGLVAGHFHGRNGQIDRARIGDPEGSAGRAARQERFAEIRAGRRGDGRRSIGHDGGIGAPH